MFFANQSAIAEKHGVAVGSHDYLAIESAYYRMAHRHRMDLCFSQTLEVLARDARGYFTGQYYSKSFGYEGPGEGVGNGTYGIGLYDQPDHGSSSGFSPATEAGWRVTSDYWVNWFEANAPETEIFKYMVDEPDSTSYPVIQERSRWIHGNSGPGGTLKSYCATISMEPALYGYVDFWALTGYCGYSTELKKYLGFSKELVSERKAQGDKIAIYNGYRPAFGRPQQIDCEAVDGRVNPWIAWKYGIDQYFLWCVNRYSQGSRRTNPSVDNYWVFGNDRAWGEGTFFYPGEDKDLPEFDKGVPGPIASIRMKNWRRGQQDYEYLWTARVVGQAQRIPEIIDSVVPYTLRMSGGAGWSNSLGVARLPI